MKFQLIKLKDCNIVVSDEEIKEDSLFIDMETFEIKTCVGFSGGKIIPKAPVSNGVAYPNLEFIRLLIASDNPEHITYKCLKEMSNHNIDTNFSKKPVPLPTINYNGLEEVFGIVDVEKLARERYDEILYDFEKYRSGFIEGFKKAQSLNDKHFSSNVVRQMLIDISKFISTKELKDDWDSNPDSFYQKRNSFIDGQIELTKQPEIFDIKIEMEEFDHSEKWSDLGSTYEVFKLRPKIQNNQIKINTKI
jgi:hypothetical protein